MLNPTQRQQPPSPYQQFRQQLSAPAGRINRKQSRISPEPVGFQSTFSIEERTFQDPYTGAFVTLREGVSYLLACGCVASTPYDIMACPHCSRQKRKGDWKGLRLVCKSHGICIECARAQAIAANGGGPIRKLISGLLTLLLWPLFDRRTDDEEI